MTRREIIALVAGVVVFLILFLIALDNGVILGDRRGGRPHSVR
jgi:hypothetical protein